MTSIVLVQPPRSGEQTFPFDIAVVSAVLKEKGLDVLGVDLGTVRADERGPVRAAIAKADLVYFSSWTLGLPGQPRAWRLRARAAPGPRYGRPWRTSRAAPPCPMTGARRR